MKALRNHTSARCYVIEKNDTTTFISYSTPVIIMRMIDGIRHMECTGTYSATTRKHIGYFLKEYAPDLNYYDMKNIVGKGMVKM